MSISWLKVVSFVSLTALLGTAAMAGFPSPNDPSNLAKPNEAPATATDPRFTCTRATLAAQWIARDTRISNVHGALDKLITEFGALNQDLFGPAPPAQIAAGVKPVTPRDAAHEKFKIAMGQFIELATTAAINTREECRQCQLIADYQVLEALARNDNGELIHTDKLRKISMSDIDESLVRAADTNIAILRGFLRESRKHWFTPVQLSSQIASEKDAIVVGMLGLMAARPATGGPRNAQMIALAKQYTCPGFNE